MGGVIFCHVILRMSQAIIPPPTQKIINAVMRDSIRVGTAYPKLDPHALRAFN